MRAGDPRQSRELLFAELFVLPPQNTSRRRGPLSHSCATPYEKLRSLTDASKYLKPEVSFTSLDRLAQTMSDTESARKMSRAKAVLLRLCKLESPTPPKFS
jgi:hypothetical protein